MRTCSALLLPDEFLSSAPLLGLFNMLNIRAFRSSVIAPPTLPLLEFDLKK